MATEVWGRAGVDIALTAQNNDGGLVDERVVAGLIEALQFQIGSGSGQLDQIYSKKIQIAAGADHEYDLDSSATGDDGSPLVDPFGASLNFDQLKVMLIFHHPDSAASSISIGSNSDIGVVSTNLVLEKGGIFLFVGPLVGESIFSTGNDQVEIDNDDGSNAADVTVVFAGTA